MPSRNIQREFASNSYYHVYNRGVEKRSTFVDEQDYNVFLLYLKTYLLPKDEENLQSQLASSTLAWSEKDKILKLLRMNNYVDEIQLLSYCLMPNHFHFLLYQQDEASIASFMNSLFTRYVMYFNRKYKRVGSLFQDVYKAVTIATDEQLLYLTRYHHRNPLPILQGVPLQTLQTYTYSSYQDYLGLRKQPWVQTDTVLSFFKEGSTQNYKSFVEENAQNSFTLQHLKGKIFES